MLNLCVWRKMLIRKYLEEKSWSVPESYDSKQWESVKEILEMFQDIDLDTEEKFLQVRLQDPTTVVILSASISHPIKHNKSPLTLIIRKFS